ncbi:MAG: hypothetical protein LVR00_01130 [Rhabdochlamydiaceae bacterium]|jgi:hypothetical protein
MQTLKAIPLPLIDDPLYVVNFSLPIDTPLPVERLLLADRVQRVGLRAIELIRLLFASFAESLFKNIRYSWEGFKIIVLH